jgi:hypothetical protein
MSYFKNDLKWLKNIIVPPKPQIELETEHRT